MGKIYDLDAPGVSAFASQTADFTLRYRVNFKFWAMIEIDGGWWGAWKIRCSEKKAWYSRQSYKLTGATDKGKATAATVNTLTDAGKAWAVDKWKDGAIIIHTGTGSKPFRQHRRITGNTATKLTVTPN